MLKRPGKNCTRLPRGSKGSAIIVVLVAMAFVSVLVAVLLSLALTNIQMKKMDKGAKGNFYSAESVMNEIRAGIQADVSEAIKLAYSDVLVSYNTASRDEQYNNFRKKFYEKLSDTASINLLVSSGTNYAYSAYNIGRLQAYVAPPQSGATVDISGSQTAQSVLDDASLPTSVTLKNVRVRFVSKGFETTVSSDIMIASPQLPYVSTTFTQTSAPDYAIIAKGLLQQPAGTGTVGISGSVYAGGLRVGGSGNIFNAVNSENFVLGGPAEVLGGALSFNANSSLWATNITLDGAGSVSVAGYTYISNDLNLKSAGTQAVLSGSYFGYGTSTTDPNSSSAILINGRDTLLDMSALRSLMLAGRSFVDYTAGGNGYVMTGESISVKPNQLAYLVPETCLPNVTNPYQYQVESELDGLGDQVNFQTAVLGTKKLSDYNIKSGADIQIIRKSVGEIKLAYICLKFPTPADASAYFKDYYGANKPTVQKYLDLYTNGILLQSTATVNLAADAYTFNGTALGDLIDPNLTITDPNNPPVSIKAIRDAYACLCVTLSRTEPGSGATNPYDYYIDSSATSQFNKIPAARPQFYPDDGAPKAVVTKGDYTISSVVNGSGTPDSVHLVIATGDVTVSRDFQGLILAGGTVTLYKTVTANGAMVEDALQALSNDDDNNLEYTYYYLNPLHISPLNSNATSAGVNGWDLSTLVSYQNWAKNKS